MILNKKKKLAKNLGIFARDFSHLLGPSFKDVESSLHGPNNQFLAYKEDISIKCTKLL
jgi:hypothetical protein